MLVQEGKGGVNICWASAVRRAPGSCRPMETSPQSSRQVLPESGFKKVTGPNESWCSCVLIVSLPPLRSLL